MKPVAAVVTRLVEEMASLKEETAVEVMGVVIDLRRRRRSFTYVLREEHHEAMETTPYVLVNNLVW